MLCIYLKEKNLADNNYIINLHSFKFRKIKVDRSEFIMVQENRGISTYLIFK